LKYSAFYTLYTVQNKGICNHQIIYTEFLYFTLFIEEIIALAGKEKAIIVTQDEDFKRIKHYHQLYKQHSVGVIFYKSPSGGMTYWEVVKSFIKTWEDMKANLSKFTPPFVCEITKTGFTDRTSLIDKKK